MDTILIIYCAFAYLFMLGQLLASWTIPLKKSNWINDIIVLLLSPVTFPLYLGATSRVKK